MGWIRNSENGKPLRNWRNYERIEFFYDLRNGGGGIGIRIEIELLLRSEQFLKAQVIEGKGFD